MTDVDYQGDTYYTIRNLSLYECQGWCREEPECAAASFRYDSRVKIRRRFMLRSKTDYIFLSDFVNPQQKFRGINWTKKRVNLILHIAI